MQLPRHRIGAIRIRLLDVTRIRNTKAPRQLTQRYRRLAERNQLRSTRLHALRHYSATELLTAGIDVRTVAGRLGHGSGGATTLHFYAAWVNEADKKAAAAIANVIPRPNPLLRKPRSPYELLASELREAIERGDYPPGVAPPTTAPTRPDDQSRTRGDRPPPPPRRIRLHD